MRQSIVGDLKRALASVPGVRVWHKRLTVDGERYRLDVIRRHAGDPEVVRVKLTALRGPGQLEPGGSRLELTCLKDHLAEWAGWIVAFLRADSTVPEPPFPVSRQLAEFGRGCRYLWEAEALRIHRSTHPQAIG